ncbi:ABC transporter permease [Burkholderia sp. Ac-20344]|uniref:ABC transporter permease n=1 Tax=Burkholderia sp. Ac-20344 TaxID=2703890 RepID=UPI00197B1798|nr:ABC transporter permease [Burkholderia sp. Ac-20344]MBN3830356.1 ABC transporter permease [Burkholderia sp. Ac-20344]
MPDTAYVPPAAPPVHTDRQYRHVKLRAQVRALLLILPLVAFLVAFFLLPIAQMLYRSVDASAVALPLAQVHAELANWSGEGAPSEGAYKALGKELMTLDDRDELGQVARELSYRYTGFEGLLRKTVRHLEESGGTPGTWKSRFVGIDPRWGTPEPWGVIKYSSGKITAQNLLAAVDLRQTATGSVAIQPEDQRLYLAVFTNTLVISVSATLACLLLGFPVAHLIATARRRTATVLMMLVLLPFWTSLLVRTSGWLVILQTNGPLEDLLVWLHVVADSARPQLAYTRFASIVAMTHILLPFMILPLYSVMKGVSKDYVRAACSLGAGPVKAFFSVYIPQVVPGIAAGAMMVFISALGFYITPALVGGSEGQMVGNLIAYHMQSSLNWGLAAALSVGLLLLVADIFWMFRTLASAELVGAPK